MNRTLLTVSAALSTSSLLLVDSAIKGGVLLLLAALVAVLLRRDSAATRHLVWQVSIVGMLVVPAFSAVLPQWRILPAWAVIPAAPEADNLEAVEPRLPAPTFDSAASTRTPVASPPISSGLIDIEAVQPTPIVTNQPVVELTVTQPVLLPIENISEPPHQWSVLDALPTLWLAGFSVLMLRLMAARLMLWSGERRGKVIALSQMSTLNASTTEPSDEAIFDAFQTACQQLAVRQPVRLLVHSEQSIPVVWGIIRLRLLLPENARTWSAEQLQSVLLHELAHIKRRDAIAQLLAQVACALHWFNPLVWFASWRLHVERERACDDLVLANGVSPSAYAEHLLDVATRLSSAPWTQACGLAMARKSSLEGRLVAVLNRRSNRRSVSASVAALALFAGFGIAMPVAMLRPTDAVLAADNVSEDGAESVDTNQEDSPVSDATTENAKSEAAMPADTTAAVLLKRWQALEERKSPISEASLARLRSAIDKWVKQPPVKADAAQVLALRDRNIDRTEHLTFEVAGWLSAIAAINRGPLEFAINGETRIGGALSEERRATLKFGPVAENGLRAAWSRYPERDTYVVGDVVTSALVIHNASDKTVEFTCPYSVDSLVRWRVTSQDGRNIPAKTSSLRGSTPVFTWRLMPGEATSIGGRSVAIGVGARREKMDNFPTTAVLHVQSGEDVTVRWDVRKPVEMVTGDVSFRIVAAEDVPVWSTRRAGEWQLSGGVTMEVKQELVHATDVASTAVLTWPQDKDGVTARHKIWLAGDAFANRESWLLAWERDATELWALKGEMQSSQDFPSVLATPAFIRRIDFSDPQRITDTTWTSLPEVLPDAIRAKLTEGFLPMKAEPTGSARKEPGQRIYRAEDLRPLAQLLNGTWIAPLGNAKLSVIFSEGTNMVQWDAPNPQDSSAEPVVETLTRLQSPGEDFLRLIRNENSPVGKKPMLVARLKRGVGDTLLLEVLDRNAFPKGVDTSGIVLHREFAVAGNARPATEPTSTARSAVELKPEHRVAQTLFKIWQANARTDGKIPGALIGRLREMVEYFNQLNKDETKELVAKFEALLSRFDATVDWSPVDAVELLNDVLAVHRIPLNNALDNAAERVILTGEPLPVELINAPWGKPAANGLRVAWHLSPIAKEYRLGTSLKSRILVHNSGKETVFFIMPSWQQSSTHTAHDGGNKAINVSSTDWTTRATLKIVRLAPGSYFETPAPAIGVGTRSEDEDWANIRPGAWIEAKEGDDVRLTPGLIEVRYSPRSVGTRMVNDRPTNTDPKDAAELWDRIVTERLDREMPFPTGAADREQLLRRVMRDLFDEEPNQGEINAYVADKSPGAVHPVTGRDLLKARVIHSRKVSAFTGTLPSGDITFRVLAADPDAANRPRVANGPGFYNIADKRRLAISQSHNGKRWVNTAEIIFYSFYSSDKDTPKPYTVTLPEGRLTYAVVWDRDATELRVTQKGLLRRIDFSSPSEVKEVRFKSADNSDIPERFRKAIREVLDVPGAPVQQQSSAKPKGGTKLEFAIESQLRWGEPVNGLRAALCRLPSLGEPKTGYMDFDLVVQNVSKVSIRLMANSAVPDTRMVRVRRDGSTLFGIKSDKPSGVDYIIQPHEVVVLHVYPPDEYKKDVQGRSMAEKPEFTFHAQLEIVKAPAGAWSGKLHTPDVSGAVILGKQLPKNKDAVAPPKPKGGAKLDAGSEANLKWGATVNGLRAAMTFRRPGDELNDLYVVV